MEYSSVVSRESAVMEGVSYTIARMSFGRRVELTRRIRDLGKRIEFLEAGDDLKEKLEAAVLSHEIEKLYLEWGLRAVEGLEIDGRPATPQALIADGPEDLCQEIAAAIKGECGLSEDERKNS